MTLGTRSNRSKRIERSDSSDIRDRNDRIYFSLNSTMFFEAATEATEVAVLRMRSMTFCSIPQCVVSQRQ